MRHKVLCSVGIASVVVVFCGCGSTSRSVGDYRPAFSTNGLVQDTSELPAIVYRRPGAPGLNAYTRFMVDPIGVRYDQDSIKRDPEQLVSLTNYFKEELESELRKSGYSIANAPGPQTLRISAIISNVKTSGKVATAGNVATMVAAPITPSVGGVTVEVAFTESKSNRIDGLAIQRSQGRRVMN